MKTIALALLFANLAVGTSFAFNPQPDPPGKVALNPQPEPPGSHQALGSLSFSASSKVSLNPQPLPPKQGN